MPSFKISSSEFTFLLLSSIGLLIAMLGGLILPLRFLADVPTILKQTPGLKGSYAFTSWFYNVLTPLGKLPLIIVGFIQFLTAIFILKKIGIPKKFHIINLKNSITYFSFFILGIFLCMPTKEYINFIYIYIIIILYLKSKKTLLKKKISSLCLILFFGFFFRPYYLLIGFLMIFFSFFNKLKLKNKRFNSLSFALVIMIGISLSYGVIKGKYMTVETREEVNIERMKRENVNTVILSPVKVDNWYDEGISILYGFFTVNIPFNGFKHFLSPHILGFIIWEIFLFILLYFEYNKSIKNEIFYQNKWLFYFLFSFLIAQGVFEPDLGSAVRHKAGIFPLIYYLLYYRNFDSKRYNIK
ncbi:hypothetical protein [Tenacibaculum agarivorans]|uniref:hypothetical protein n=1 Tax=Tenacibaculum agarivorans TaxID=1908389 RepID=UPI00094B99F9|nr:hypothetical protein [Tenacibaculum agarivorans]